MWGISMAVLHKEYFDGKSLSPSAIDQTILDYMETSCKEYYDEEISDDGRFQVWMQLSSLRTGLFSWYDFRKNAEVLEIGAGFGALTGILCEKCGHVWATEKLWHRAAAIASRWEKKKNLDVYAGEWSKMNFGRKFDYVILTGILEKACNGVADRRQYIDYIKNVLKLLKKDGILLVAVENRLGLKYFCGAKGTYSRKAFEGINGYPNGGRGYTFSRQELNNIIKEAGFSQLKFYYPLPDYKLPQMIYTDEYLPERNLKERLIPYYTDKNSLIVMEIDLYDDVIENGAFPFFANSFLVECGKEEDMNTAVYAAVSTDRGMERGCATVIYQENKVCKRALFREGIKNLKLMCHNLEDLKTHKIPVVDYQWNGTDISMPYVPYPMLSNYLKLLIAADTERFIKILDQLYALILHSSNQIHGRNKLAEWLCEQSENEEEKEIIRMLDWGPVLEKVYIELIPLNCFYDPEKGAFLFFDQEFVREEYPAKYTLFRAIHYIYCFTPNAGKYLSQKKLYERYGMERLWNYFVKEEHRFLDEIRNHRKYGQFYLWAGIDKKAVYKNADKLQSEEERIAEYKISDKMKRTWKVELAMLDEVERICRKYKLTYFLVHGSLLGALRHKGFIPWDDDLDIAMPRKDYDQFLQIAESELKEPLSLHTPKTEEDMFWGGYARMRNGITTGMEVRFLGRKGNLGIWIDILPLDICPMDESKFEKKQRRIRHCHRLINAKINKKTPVKIGDIKKINWNCYKLMAKFYSHEKICHMLDDAMQMYDGEDSEDVAFFTSSYGHRRLSAKDFMGTKLLEFEHRKVPVPAGYENYLFMTMGKDYLKYPPEEERKPKHKGIFDPERTYKEYTDILCGKFDNVKGKQIILFGSGKMFEDYMQKFGRKYRPSFLVDNDETKWGRQRMGIDIKKPEAIFDVSEDNRRLIICSFYYREIIQQLEQLGIHEYKVYVQRIDWILKTEEERK